MRRQSKGSIIITRLVLTCFTVTDILIGEDGPWTCTSQSYQMKHQAYEHQLLHCILAIKNYQYAQILPSSSTIVPPPFCKMGTTQSFGGRGKGCSSSVSIILVFICAFSLYSFSHDINSNRFFQVENITTYEESGPSNIVLTPHQQKSFILQSKKI